MPGISIVIPAWRLDAPLLGEAIARLRAQGAEQVIVAVPRGEGREVLAAAGATAGVHCIEAPRGRGAQMNAGAAVATGDWILFLHADTRLPDGWQQDITSAGADAQVVGGCFRFRLDSHDFRARLIEWGVRARVALAHLPYGDQALFVRRSHFEAIGGFADLPLMEDVDLVGRLRRRGRLYVSRRPVVTSTRRWKRDGWLRRSAHNLWLLLQWRMGVSPKRLARAYYGRRRAAIGMMARAPSAPGKTRLLAVGSPDRRAALRAALFDDTLAAVRQVASADHVIVCEPPDAAAECRQRAGDIEVVPQRTGDLGDRLRGAFEDMWRLGAEEVVLVGSDIPDLPSSHLRQAIDALQRPGDRLVIGPADDGGYYLIGLKAPHPALFEGMAWGTRTVFARTVDAARRAGLEVTVLEPWADVDEPEDLARLACSPVGDAPRTREWVAASAEAAGRW